MAFLCKSFVFDFGSANTIISKSEEVKFDMATAKGKFHARRFRP